ncbi:MAG: DUF4783 domain-containing protein, partial [Paludibacteraceae bacterium]|nr:DUF4783 domain-containing protein [Paludibacteraceae bacterium]
LLLIGCLLVLVHAASAQTDWGQRLSAGLQSANATALTSGFGAEVEVSVLGRTGVMGPRQAQELLEDFFAGHAPQACSISHQGTRETSSFFIFSYQDTTGHTYRIYCVVRKSDEGQFVKQFRIDYVR